MPKEGKNCDKEISTRSGILAGGNKNLLSSIYQAWKTDKEPAACMHIHKLLYNTQVQYNNDKETRGALYYI